MVRLANVCTMAGGREVQERQQAARAQEVEERRKSKSAFVQNQRKKWIEEGDLWRVRWRRRV